MGYVGSILSPSEFRELQTSLERGRKFESAEQSAAATSIVAFFMKGYPIKELTSAEPFYSAFRRLTS